MTKAKQKGKQKETISYRAGFNFLIQWSEHKSWKIHLLLHKLLYGHDSVQPWLERCDFYLKNC